MKHSKKLCLSVAVVGLVIHFGSERPVAVSAPVAAKALPSLTAALAPIVAPAQGQVAVQTPPPVSSGHVLRSEATVRTDVMTTTQFQDYFREPFTGEWIEVVGSKSMIHQGANGSLISNKLAHWSRTFGKPMTVAQAIAASRNTAGTPLRVQLKVLPDQQRTDARLVYWLDYEKRLVIVDAESGHIVHDISKHRTIAALPKIKVYSAQGLGEHTDLYGSETDDSDIPEELRNSCQLISTKEGSEGTTLVINPGLCTLRADNSRALSGADEDSLRALDNSRQVAGYYAEKHGRSSFDGKGTELVNVVHAGDSLDNAFWDEEHSYMAYGDGDGKGSASYTLSLDIAGHEMTHGVIAATAKLLGTSESGALNEAYADFFGIMISNMKDPNPDWTIAKEIVAAANGKPAGLRSLAQPGKFTTSTFTDDKMDKSEEVPFPSKVSQKLGNGQDCSEKNDQCEVHANATIPGHASYLVAKALETSGGLPRNRYDRAAKLYYTVLTQWLTATDGFANAARDTIEACKLMYDARTCSQVEQAFVETEMMN